MMDPAEQPVGTHLVYNDGAMNAAWIKVNHEQWFPLPDSVGSSSPLEVTGDGEIRGHILMHTGEGGVCAFL